MNTNYAAPIATNVADTFVPVAEWEKLLMVWTLRSLRPAVDGFTTVSFAMQFDGTKYHVVERVNGNCTSAIKDGFSLSRSFDNKDEALDYWGEQIRSATPPCAQGVLPGLVEASANFIETYAYTGGFGGAPCAQSHARVGSWS